MQEFARRAAALLETFGALGIVAEAIGAAVFVTPAAVAVTQLVVIAASAPGERRRTAVAPFDGGRVAIAATDTAGAGAVPPIVMREFAWRVFPLVGPVIARLGVARRLVTMAPVIALGVSDKGAVGPCARRR